jgi:hypothetical protein
MFLFDVADSIGRKWQLGTIQLDYAAPERFELNYVGEDNHDHRAVVIHRAVSGSFEQGTDHFAADRPRAEDTDAQAGAAHDLGRAGRDIRRMVADPSEGPPGRRRGQHPVGYTPER